MSKFQESLIRTAAMRSRVASDMLPLFDHLVRLAKDSHRNPLYAKRAGRELRKARRLAGSTGYAIPLEVEPFSDVYGSEGIMGAYELPEMQERVGGPLDLPMIGGCAPPSSVAGAHWLYQTSPGHFMPTRRALRAMYPNLYNRRGRPYAAIGAGTSYELECAGYEEAHRTLVAAAGAMIAGWPAGSEFVVGFAGPMVIGSLNDNIASQHNKVLALIKSWGINPTPAQMTDLTNARNNAQRLSGDSRHRWDAFGAWKGAILKIVRKQAPGGPHERSLESLFSGLAGTYPSGGGVFSSISNAVSSVTKAVGNTVTSAAQTLVDGVRKYNPVALAKVAAIKAKALAGDIANSAVFKTLGAIASKALAPALSVIKNVAGPILPYVQSVISFVPGVGTGISAALGAAQALADGRSITDAIVAGAKGMLPGGPLAATAFDAAWGLAHGRPIDSIALEALRNQLPGDLAKKAFDTGLALATAKTAQDRKAALGTAVLGAIASNVQIPTAITNIAAPIAQAVAPAVNIARQAQSAVQTAQRAVATANAVRAIAQNPAAIANLAKAAAAKAAAARLAAARAAMAQR